MLPLLAAVLVGGALLAQAPQNPSPMTDSTRPHPRVPKSELPGLRLPLETGTLFVPSRTRARSEVNLAVHFHGATWLAEQHISRLANTAGIAVHLGAGSGVYSRAFSDAARFLRLLDEAQGKLADAWKRPVRWKKLTLVSFSAGYGAIREILKDPQCYNRVDAVLLADSLHSGYGGADGPGPVAPEPLEPFLKLARDALAGRKLLWVTHSEVFPGTFASTTETADYLLTALRLRRRPVLRPGPLGMQQLSRVDAGGFHLRGYAGNSAPDHVDHFYAMSAWLKQMR